MNQWLNNQLQRCLQTSPGYTGSVNDIIFVIVELSHVYKLKSLPVSSKVKLYNNTQIYFKFYKNCHIRRTPIAVAHGHLRLHKLGQRILRLRLRLASYKSPEKRVQQHLQNNSLVQNIGRPCCKWFGADSEIWAFLVPH